MHHGLTDIPGLLVGHWTHLPAATGCSVVLCPTGAVAGVDVRGTAPGTRETDLLDPICMIEQVHAILIGGGSAFGLAAADGVMRWLEERGHGFPVGVANVPIVPAAILFDLGIGDATTRPGSDAGYAACQAANSGPVAQGNVGAGTGATTGKMLGFGQATKTGLGSASKMIGGGVVIAAMVAVNAVGDVIDPKTQKIIAGARQVEGEGFIDSLKFAEAQHHQTMDQRAVSTMGANTTLAVVATNVALSKSEATKVAQMAQDGLARTIRPAHTHMDGDTIFALSLGDKEANLSLVGALATEVLAEAVVNAVYAAETLAGIPAANALSWVQRSSLQR